MLLIFVRPERVGPKLSSVQGIRANLVYIVSLRGSYKNMKILRNLCLHYKARWARRKEKRRKSRNQSDQKPQNVGLKKQK